MKKLFALALTLTAAFTLAACDTDDSEFAANPDIVGIEGGAGIMTSAENAIEDYGLEMDLLTSSEVAMVSALESAIQDEEWVVVTGWVPHFKFSQFDLKFLEDPEGSFGAEEDIVPVGRDGLTDDHPDVVALLDNMYFDDDTFGALIEAFNEADDDDSDYDAAFAWYEDNEDTWSDWIPADADGDGEEIQVGYVAWEDGITISHALQVLLEEEMNYDVELTQADAGPVFQDLANGNIDVMPHAWLPHTHSQYSDSYADDWEEYAPSYEGARIGLVVPTYVDIDSIEELNDYFE